VIVGFRDVDVDGLGEGVGLVVGVSVGSVSGDKSCD